MIDSPSRRINESLMRSLHNGSFLTGQRKIVMVSGRAPARRMSPAPLPPTLYEMTPAAATFITVDLVKCLKKETRGVGGGRYMGDRLRLGRLVRRLAITSADRGR